jgi:hypothetical protein
VEVRPGGREVTSVAVLEKDETFGDAMAAELLLAGRSAEAVERAGLVLRTLDDPRRAAVLSLVCLVGNLNLGRWNGPEYADAEDAAPSPSRGSPPRRSSASSTVWWRGSPT